MKQYIGLKQIKQSTTKEEETNLRTEIDLFNSELLYNIYKQSETEEIWFMLLIHKTNNFKTGSLNQ